MYKLKVTDEQTRKVQVVKVLNVQTQITDEQTSNVQVVKILNVQTQGHR